MFTCRFYLSEVFRLSSAQSSIMLSGGDVFQLKEIFIIVNTSSDHNNDEALEVYRFSFAYTLDAMPTSRKTTTSKRRVSYYGVDTVRMQIADAARHIYALADSLSVLPDGCHSTIKITYYDERTPEEYEPEGFIADSRLFRFIRPAKRVALGRVDCEQHACSLLVASIFIGNPWAMKMTLDSYYLSTSVRSRDSDTNQSGISNSELYPSFQKNDGLLLISPAHVSSRGRSASVNSSLCIAVEGCTINSLDTDVLEGLNVSRAINLSKFIGGQESGSPRPTICGLAFAADKNRSFNFSFLFFALLLNSVKLSTHLFSGFIVWRKETIGMNPIICLVLSVRIEIHNVTIIFAALENVQFCCSSFCVHFLPL
uniref:HORMA domain-containing protein n=1 Tax=Ascaris lumbricoides TaxID=6252 RepID=A0A0M3I9G6_ASCLU